MPMLGYGVWQVADAEAETLVAHAIHSGYRSIDTASIYDNERGVGAGVASCGVDRGELFIATKLWNDRHRGDEPSRALDESLERLGMDRVDLYLVHWPSPVVGAYEAAWRSLVAAQADGRATSIGVSNHAIEHLDRITTATGVAPAVNQVELHPYFQQQELRAWHAERGIVTEAWSPLGQGGELLQDPVLVGIAREHGCTPAQVVLAWHRAMGIVAIPKSATPARIVENLASVDVQLTAADVAAIEALDRGAAGRIGPDPSTAQF